MRNKRWGENLNVDDIKKMKYTWQVARESMRLFPPIFGSFRKAITDIEYEEFTIPRGWKVNITSFLSYTCYIHLLALSLYISKNESRCI